MKVVPTRHISTFCELHSNPTRFTRQHSDALYLLKCRMSAAKHHVLDTGGNLVQR
jgi:hypothetical protein